MEIIKIINDINSSIKVLDISNSLTLSTLPIYMDSIKHNKLSILLVQKNKRNNEVFEMMESLTDNESQTKWSRSNLPSVAGPRPFRSLRLFNIFLR